MTIEVKSKPRPINANLLGSSIFGGSAWFAWQATGEVWQWGVVAGFCGLTSAALAKAGVTHIIEDYKVRLHIKQSRKVSEDHGDAKVESFEGRDARGMHKLLTTIAGLVDGVPIGPPEDNIFTGVLAPPGVGKTSRISLSEVIHQALLGKSQLIIDVKCDMGPMLIPALRRLGFDVMVINPARKHIKKCGATPINLYQPVLDAVYAKDEMRLDASKLANDHAHMHVPTKVSQDQGNTLFFTNGTKRAIATAILVLALTDPANCTPTGAFNLLNDSKLFIKTLKDFRDHFEALEEGDRLVGFVKSEANNLMIHAESDGENRYIETFLEGATQALHPFNESGRLANFGSDAVRKISEMRSKQVIVFVMSPLSHKREFAPFNSMINQAVMTACKYVPDGHPIHIVGEEMLAYDYTDLTGDMETLREYRVSGTFYFQSLAGLEKKLGKEGVKAFLAYCDTFIAAGVSSPDESKLLSELLSEATIKKQNYSMSAIAAKVDVSSQELGKRLMTDSQIRRMGKSQAWMLCRGMNPILFDLLPDGWGSVDPWCDWIGPHPIHGTKLPRKPLFKIKYPNLVDMESGNV